MKQMKNLLALIFVAATVALASCDRPAKTPASLAGTTWEAQNSTGTQTMLNRIIFTNESEGLYYIRETYEDQSHDYYYEIEYSYTFDDGTGTGTGQLSITDISSPSVTFTVDANTLTPSGENGNITFQRCASQHLPASTGLEGTTWQGEERGTTTDDDGVSHESILTFTLKFNTCVTGTLTVDYVVPDLPEEGHSDSHHLTYTYSAPQGTVIHNLSGHTMPFEIDGNTMSLQVEPRENRRYTLHKI